MWAIPVRSIKTGFVADIVPPSSFKELGAVIGSPFIIILVNRGEFCTVWESKRVPCSAAYRLNKNKKKPRLTFVKAPFD